MITNSQNVQNNTNTSPRPVTQNTLIDRFSPIYWRIDGPQTMSLPLQTMEMVLKHLLDHV